MSLTARRFAAHRAKLEAGEVALDQVYLVKHLMTVWAAKLIGASA